MESLAEDGEPIFELSQTVDMGMDARSIDVDPVLLRTEAVRSRCIGAPAVAQFCAPAHLTPHLRPSAYG